MGVKALKIILKVILCIILCVVSIAARLLIILAISPMQVTHYSEAKHIKRISKRIEKSYMTGDKEYTDFSVYPLYNEKEEPRLYLVEFEPYGYILVDPDESLFGYLIGRNYIVCGGREWSPYTVDEADGRAYHNEDKVFETDENGERIIYNRSPYFVSGKIDERKYFLRAEAYSGGYYTCAVRKDGDTFINLISSAEMSVSDGDLNKNQAVIFATFIPQKPFFL